jgi:hypothetical protein
MFKPTLTLRTRHPWAERAGYAKVFNIVDGINKDHHSGELIKLSPFREDGVRVATVRHVINDREFYEYPLVNFSRFRRVRFKNHSRSIDYKENNT